MKRLTHGRYGFTLEIKENQVYEIVVESPAILTEVVKELTLQLEGSEGEFRLSEGEKLLSVEKNMVFIKDIFSLDVNQKKVLSKLYTELNESAYSICLQEKSEFIEAYISYLDSICEKSDLFLAYEEEPDVQELFKLAKLKIQADAVSVLELIIEYIKVMSRLMRLDIFVFLNLKLFLAKDELEVLYTECFNRKVCLILIEASLQEKMQYEKGCIIDKDKCIIYF